MPKYTIDGEEIDLATLMNRIEAVPKSRLDTAIQARKAAETEVDRLSDAAKGVEKAQKRIGELEAQLGQLQTVTELAKVGITDERVVKSLRAVHAAEVDGMEKPPSLAEWLAGDGAAHPMVKAAMPQPTAQPADAARTAAPKVTVQGNAGTIQSQPGGKWTPAQVQTYLQSPEWKAKIAGKSSAEKLAMLDALEAQTVTEGTATP